jgi:hypothetical protein
MCSFVVVFVQCGPVHGQYLQSSISSLRVIACLLRPGAHPTLQNVRVCWCNIVIGQHTPLYYAKEKFLLWGTRVMNVPINFVQLRVWPIEHVGLTVMP